MNKKILLAGITLACCAATLVAEEAGSKTPEATRFEREKKQKEITNQGLMLGLALNGASFIAWKKILETYSHDSSSGFSYIILSGIAGKLACEGLRKMTHNRLKNTIPDDAKVSDLELKNLERKAEEAVPAHIWGELAAIAIYLVTKLYPTQDY